jgi:hypothetical protein
MPPSQASSDEEKKNEISVRAFSGESEPWIAFRSMSVPNCCLMLRGATL